MSETIYIDDLECPYCDSDTLTTCWDVEVDPNSYTKVTDVTCEDCGKVFEVVTRLGVIVRKKEGA